MERIKVDTKRYVVILNEELSRHPDYMLGMKFYDMTPELKVVLYK
jgi:hypothetical protein